MNSNWLFSMLSKSGITDVTLNLVLLYTMFSTAGERQLNYFHPRICLVLSCYLTRIQLGSLCRQHCTSFQAQGDFYYHKP